MAFHPLAKYKDWWTDKVREGVRSRLGSNEVVRAATYGQEVGSFWLSIVCFWKPRLIVVTDSRVLLLRSGIANSAKAGTLVDEASLTSQPLRREGRGLAFNGRVVFPSPGAKHETDDVMRVALIDKLPVTASAVARPSTPQASVPPPA